MLTPVPFAAISSGAIEDAPTGSIPISIYGVESSGGGGDDGRSHQYASDNINAQVPSKWELSYSTGNFDWLSLRIQQQTLTEVGSSKFLVLTLPESFTVDAPEGYTIFNERSFNLFVQLLGNNESGLVSVDGSVILGDTSAAGVPGKNVVIIFSSFRYSTNSEITESNFRDGLITLTF